eukprot:maker-scaffold_1-snap-gene-27.52-mRNA-1 protein AED:0.01 eAED:0.00 QI:58/1/0.75/1/1/1/4/159/842
METELPTAKRLRDLVVDHFTVYAPEKLQLNLDINGIVLWTMRNGIDALNSVLLAQTGHKLDLNKNLGNARKRAERISAVFLGDRGKNKQQETVIQSKLHKFYMEHDPSKLSNIHKLVRYGLLNGEEALSKRLQEKYGVGLPVKAPRMQEYNILNKTLNNVPVPEKNIEIIQMKPVVKSRKNLYQNKTARETVDTFLDQSTIDEEVPSFPIEDTDMESQFETEMERQMTSPSSNANSRKKKRKRRKKYKKKKPQQQFINRDSYDEEFANLYGEDSKRWRDEVPPPVPQKRRNSFKENIILEKPKSFSTDKMKSSRSLHGNKSKRKIQRTKPKSVKWTDQSRSRSEVLLEFKEFFSFHDSRNLAQEVLDEYLEIYRILGRGETNKKLETLYHGNLDQIGYNKEKMEEEAAVIAETSVQDLMKNFSKFSFNPEKLWNPQGVGKNKGNSNLRNHVSVNLRLDKKKGQGAKDYKEKMHFSLSPNAFAKGLAAYKNEISVEPAQTEDACNNYRLDMLGKVSGICVCGFPRSTHSEQAKYGPTGKNLWKKRFQTTVEVDEPASGPTAVTSLGGKQGKIGKNAKSGSFLKAFEQTKSAGSKGFQPKVKTQDKIPSAFVQKSKPPTAKEKKSPFNFKFIKPEVKKQDYTKNDAPHISVRNPNMPLKKKTLKRVSMKVTKKPIGVPCNNFRVDIAGKYHGDCVCGFSKLSHDLNFDSENTKKEYSSQLSSMKRKLSHKRTKKTQYRDTMKYNFGDLFSKPSPGNEYSNSSIRSIRSNKQRKRKNGAASSTPRANRIESVEFSSFSTAQSPSRNIAGKSGGKKKGMKKQKSGDSFLSANSRVALMRERFESGH